jgi:cell division protein FtsI (penicillin-binding protein 3)
MVDNPAHGVEGGDVAAPLFNQIASYELQHAHVPPTGSLTKHVRMQICDTAVSRLDTPSSLC